MTLRSRSLPPRRMQAGLTLVELLVGVVIGLMTIAVALGALLVSRGVSGSVSDASFLQQQAAHALRVIGLQARQAGSVRLNLAPGGVADALSPVAFEVVFDRAQDTIGSDSDDSVRLGYQNYTEQVVGSATPQSLLRDCLGRAVTGDVVLSAFRLRQAEGEATGELVCEVADGDVQAVIGNVLDFQVRYLVQERDAAGNTSIRRADADAVSDWSQVTGLDVCLELQGEERVDTAGATYRGCGWQTGAAPTPMGDRMRLVFRNSFQLRSQGAPR